MEVTRRVLLVVGVGVVVAIAANGLTLLSPRADPSGGWTWAIRLAGAAVAVVGLIGLLAYRRHLRTGGSKGRDPMTGGLRAAGPSWACSPSWRSSTRPRIPNVQDRMEAGSGWVGCLPSERAARVVR